LHEVRYHNLAVDPVMGKMSRNKGKAGEREVAALLREHGYEARRGQQFAGNVGKVGPVITRIGTDSPDVVHNVPHLHIEVKRCEALRLYAALDQADGDAPGNKVPVIFHRKNGEQWVAVMYARDFLQYIKGDLR